MKNKPVWNYGGFAIEYDENNEVFFAECGEEYGRKEAETLAKLKSKIDNLAKVKSDTPKQKPQKGIKISRSIYTDEYSFYDTIKGIKIGSFGILSSRWSNDRKEVWITDENGDRQRMGVDYALRNVYHDTPANRSVLQKVLVLDAELKKFEAEKHKQMKEILDTLENAKIKQIVKDEELPYWEK